MDELQRIRNASNAKRYRQRQKLKRLQLRNATYANVLSVTGALEKRIRYHLSKGRDACDIVVRENLSASVVIETINKILNEEKHSK